MTTMAKTVERADQPPGVRPALIRRGHKPPGELAAPFLLVLPAILIIVLIRIYPLFLGLSFSFTGDGDKSGQFIGIQNYIQLFQDPVFIASFTHILVLLAFLPLAVFFPGILATFLYLRVPGHRFYRSVYFLPAILSSVVIGAIFNRVLAVNGPLNWFLGLFGIPSVDWLGTSTTALPSVVLVQIWATFGMTLIIFLAGFSTLDQSLIDAARVDGANLRQLVRHVVIPGLSQTIQFVIVTTTIGMLTGMFGLLYVMTYGGPGTASYLPELYIWNEQGTLNRPAMASAASMVLFAITLVIGLIQIRILRRTNTED
ncbi:carbohydrate ABC transporter permease [Rathayibacter soli]|uniref:carbohydrate ABC transporter permease n=1 Tax=Rathayibacter soli TaxID=3144168 RepID=UPI0027E4EA8B|nr:sugar ABC transporter permease [Glaciibacter superstes]